MLAIEGTTIKKIQEVAGNETIAMSARYSHLSPEHRPKLHEVAAARYGSHQAGQS
jgi:hypothetical protein